MNSRQNILTYQDNFEINKSVRSIPIITSKTAEPLISIIIPTYKKPHLLKQAIDSALNQKWDGIFEIIVCDNNPSRDDDTERLMSTYSDARISYYKNEKNIGASGNWNRLNELARGKWTVMLHDDDLLKDLFLRQLTPFLNDNVDLIGFGFYPFKTKSVNLTASTITNRAQIIRFEDMWNGSPIGIAGLTVRRDKILAMGGYNPEYANPDCVFITQCCKDSLVLKIESNMAMYRIAENDSSNPSTIYRAIHNERERTTAVLRRTFPKWLAQILQIHITNSLENAWRTQFNVKFDSKEYPELKKYQIITSTYLNKGYSIFRRIFYPPKFIFS